MIEITEADYFAERAVAEQDLSRAACDPKAAAAHGDLAQRYAALADLFRLENPKLKVAYQLATKMPAPGMAVASSN